MTEKIKNFFKEIYSSRTFFLTIVFGISLVMFEAVFFPNSFTDLTIWAKHFEVGSYLRFTFVLSLSIAAFCLFLVFIYAALASPPLYRIIYFVLFSALIAAEYGYYKALSRFFKVHEAEVAVIATNWEIITNAVGMYFNYFALIPIIIFGVLLLRTKKIFNNGYIPLLVIVLSFGTFFSVTTYLTKNTYYIHSFNYAVRTVISMPITWYVGTINYKAKSSHYYSPRTRVDYQTDVLPNNNVVFIIDESLRSDHLSLNGYAKSTTPTLEALNEKGFVKNWGTAVSGTTCSTTANALLMTGLKDLPDVDFRVFKLPTIFQYAKAMNYKTHYFDGQVSTLWNGKVADRKDYGQWTTDSDLDKSVENKYERDAEVARRVRKIVNNSKGNFIWITKYGVHKPYTNSYPDDRSNLPKDSDITQYEEGIDDENLIRQYDEAIRYNSESFFKELTAVEGFGNDTIYLYTSDHGQSLREEGAKASHCNNTKAEAKVPLLLLSSPRKFT